MVSSARDRSRRSDLAPGRFLLAFLAAGTAATVSGFPVLVLVARLTGKAETLPDLGELSFAVLALLPFGLAFTVIGGLPVHLALAALRRQGVVAYALGGAAGGTCMLGTLLSLGAMGLGVRPFVQGALIGLVAGLAFRAIWRPAASDTVSRP